MSDDTVKSPWTVQVDISAGKVRRVRNTKPSEDGVPYLPLEAKLRNLFAGIAGAAEMLGDEFSGKAVGSKAEELAYGWARVAQENENVRIAIRWLVETSAWTEAAIPTAMVGVSIGWHYNLVPDSIGERVAKFAGLVPLTPEEEAEVLARVMAMQEQEPVAPESPESETEREPPQKPINDDVPVSDGPKVVPLPSDAHLDVDS